MGDLPSIWSMIQEYGYAFLDDFTKPEVKPLAYAIQNSQVLVFTEGPYPVGCVAYFDLIPGLHAKISTLVRPSWLKAVLKQDLYIDALVYAFQTWDLLKIKAEPHERQHQAMKLLKRFGFFKCGKLPDETVVNGDVVSIVPFHLRRKYIDG